MTYQDILNEAKEDIDRLDAELILGYVEKKTREKIFSNLNFSLNNEKVNTFRKLVKKRKIGFPLAYITGNKEFWKSEFIVSDVVLIPRPETELIIEEVLKEDLINKTILELGTGSGNISISIMKERPEVKIYATDKSINALLVAKKNSELNKTNKIIFLNHDWKKQWLFPSVDIIISNPPYVDKAMVDKEEDGIWFEPEEALFSGKSGFSDIEIILQKSFGFLKKNGKLLIEHAPFQSEKVADISMSIGYTEIKQKRDLNKDIRLSILEK